MAPTMRRRLVALLLSFAIIPLLILGGVLTWQNYQAGLEHVKRFQDALTRQASENISLFLHEQEHKILSFLRTNYLPAMTRREQRRLFEFFLATSRDEEHGHVFDELILLDGNGRLVVSASRTRSEADGKPLDWAESKAFTGVFPDKKVHFRPVQYNTETGEPQMEMSVPIRDLRTGELSGVLVTEIKLKFLWHMVAGMRVGEAGIAFVVDDRNRIVVHPSRSVVLQQATFRVPEQPAVMTGTRGDRAVVVAKRIEFGDQPMFILSEVPTAEAFAHLRRVITTSGFFLLITFGCAVFLGVLLVRQFVRPIESLADTARRISEGDFTRRAEASRTDELGQLATAFNSMTGRLLATIRDLEEQKDFMASAIESLSHPFYVIDADDYTVKLANSACGFETLSEDSKCYRLTHHADEPCGGPDHPCTIAEVKRTGNPVVLIHQHCREGEEAKTYEVYGYPIFDAEGNITRVIEYNLDISLRKSLEDQLRQAQKLEAIGSLASGVAHDFNNLLTTILGFAELSLMEMEGDDPERERMQTIYDAGKKAAGLTRQLLAFSRKQVLEIKVLNLNQVLEDLARMLGRLIGEQIEIKMLLRPDAGNISGDPGQIEQIIMNLAINARDAMPEGGTLIFETESVILDAEYCKLHAEVTPGPYVVLGVTDTGHGIPPAVLEKIFDPFFTTKETGSGTGLGLSTVYGIVKQHKGQIYVYSEPDHGTTFKVYFPEAGREADQSAVTDTPTMAGGTETVLVVDDEPAVREMVTAVLQPLGYTVLAASDGEDAFRISRDHAAGIDLLLTDVIMPRMTGRRLADILAPDRPAMKVLYMSGYTDNVISHQGVLEPGVQFLNKPLIPSMLTRKVREVLDRD